MALPASFALAVSPGFQVPPHIELLDRVIVETVESGGRLLVRNATTSWEERAVLAIHAGLVRRSTSRPTSDPCFARGRFRGGLGSEGARPAGGAWADNVRRGSASGLICREQVGRRAPFGGMTTAGVGGAITGRGADLLIIDDR